MKKVINLISATVVSVAMMGGFAAAATDACSIYDTGSDSYNSCETNLTNKVYAKCVNDIVVNNDNSQISSTGQALVSGNTSGGSSSSGSANNSNVTVETIGAGCQVATTTPTPTPTPTPTATTPVGGKGGGSPATVVTPQVVAPVGAVSAGAGGGAKTSDSAIAGLVASAGTVGFAVVLLGKRLLASKVG